MKILKYTLLIFLLALAQLSWAQSGNILTQTRTWNSESGYDLVVEDSLNASMKFTTVSAIRIEHRDHRDRLQTFDIVSTEGSWTNIGLPGTMIYHVSINESVGLITIERTATGIFLTVDFSNSESGGLKIRYTINTID